MQEVRKILLLGAGGHCLSVLDTLLSSYQYNSIGIIEKDKKKIESMVTNNIDNSIMGIPIIGCDNDLLRLHSEGYSDAFITLGCIGDTSIRKKLYKQIKGLGFHIPNVIDKSSIVSHYATLGEGIYIGKNSVVNAYAKIGNLAIVNTSSIIEHECVVQEFVHIATGSILCGNVQVDKETHIGAGSIVKQGIHIGSGTMIGMGSVVVTNISDKTTAYGNPCKEVNHE